MSLQKQRNQKMEKFQFAPKHKVHALLNGVYQAAVVEQVENHPTDRMLDKYYIHWIEHDRRMDQWLTSEHLRASTAPTSITKSAKSDKFNTSNVVTRRGRDVEGADEGAEATLTTPAVGVRASKGTATVRTRAGSSFFGLPKNVQTLVIGPNELDVWYFSPYLQARPSVRRRVESCAVCVRADAELTVRHQSAAPAPPAFSRASTFTLHLCPCCVHPFTDAAQVARHLASCPRHPPGREIYRDLTRKLLVFEVEGAVDTTFCQHLALLSKFFLEHKALDYDTTPFVFYVLTVITDVGCEVVGYFSREKDSPEQYNLSCIMTLPHFQGRGAGRFLIELSYEMSLRMGLAGSPEKPLSDLGERMYRSYWDEKVVEAIIANDTAGVPFTAETLARQTGICAADIIMTLQHLQLIDSRNGGANSIRLSSSAISELTRRRQRVLSVDSEHFVFDKLRLSWSPCEYLILKLKPTSAPAVSNTLYIGAEN